MKFTTSFCMNWYLLTWLTSVFLEPKVALTKDLVYLLGFGHYLQFSTILQSFIHLRNIFIRNREIFGKFPRNNSIALPFWICGIPTSIIHVLQSTYDLNPILTMQYTGHKCWQRALFNVSNVQPSKWICTLIMRYVCID